MFTASLFFAIGAFFSSFFAYPSKEATTLTYIAKMLFYFCLLAFLCLFVGGVLLSMPTPIREPTMFS